MVLCACALLSACGRHGQSPRSEPTTSTTLSAAPIISLNPQAKACADDVSGALATDSAGVQDGAQSLILTYGTQSPEFGIYGRFIAQVISDRYQHGIAAAISDNLISQVISLCQQAHP